MHTFFIPDIPPEGTLFQLDRQESVHLFKILRAKSGMEIMLTDGRGHTARATVSEGRDLIAGKTETAFPPRRKLYLYTAAPKHNRLDTMLKQAVELGVSGIGILKCERSVATPDNSGRRQLLFQEACKQSGNPFIPETLPDITVGELQKELAGRGCVGFFGAVPAICCPVSLPANFSSAAWIVGPEGGFTDAETAVLVKSGFFPITLGPYILRLETAAVCGLAVLRHLIEPGVNL